MVAIKKTTTRKKTTTKSEKEEMKAQSFFKYSLPGSSFILPLFTPFSADHYLRHLVQILLLLS